MKSVLLVDPDTSFLHRAGLALTVVGFNAHVSASTDEALETLGVRRYDLIVAAEEMPELSGSAFLAEAARLSPDARRVLTRQTANASPPDETLTREVQKPLSAEALAALVVEILGASSPAAKPDAAVGVRRTRLLQSLEEAYPGLLDVAEGAHLPQPSAELAALRRMTAATLSGDTNTAERFGFGRHLEAVAPQLLADDILVVAVQTPETTITVEPGAYQHTVHFETMTQSVPLVTLPSALGDSLAARIALLAQLDLAVPGHQMGQIVVDYDGVERTVVVALRTSGFGLGVELRCDDVIEEPAPITLTTKKPVPSPEAVESSPPEELVPGYRLLEPLGEGGIGIVYRAVHLVLETEVAIKLMLPGEAAQQNSALRMMREARAASRSRHPSIVSVLDCGRLPDQRAYIIMELVAAPTLDKILEKNGALPIAEAVRIIKRVAEALENAHSVGVIHRDIKPSNIFVSEETDDPTTSIVKLSDFGAAQLDDASPGATGEHLTVGTPHYMAPEQARSSRVDRRSDIYSLGCVLFEMLSGKPPYAGKTALDVIAQHVLSPVPAVTSPLGPLPLAVTRALRRALAKNPDERHQNARELINDLEGATASIERTGWRRWLP